MLLPVPTVSPLGALAGTFVMVLSPMRQLFGFVTISAALGWTILVVVIGYLACAEIAKRLVTATPARPQRTEG